jgi:hypothetical protein
MKQVTDVLFVCFALVFFASRLVIFPSYVMRSALVEGWAYVGDYMGLKVLHHIPLTVYETDHKQFQ